LIQLPDKALHSGQLLDLLGHGFLLPDMIGRVASFVVDTINSNAVEVEEKIEVLCTAFERKKTVLLSEWDRKGV